jgi:hypothetical protein
VRLQFFYNNRNAHSEKIAAKNVQICGGPMGYVPSGSPCFLLAGSLSADFDLPMNIFGSPLGNGINFHNVLALLSKSPRKFKHSRRVSMGFFHTFGHLPKGLRESLGIFLQRSSLSLAFFKLFTGSSVFMFLVIKNDPPENFKYHQRIFS